MNNNYYRDMNTIPNYINNQYQMNKSYYTNKNIEDIFALNKGKKVSIYESFPYSNENEKTFTGIIEDSYKDYIILSDPKTGNWYIIPIKYINYIKFNENINNQIYNNSN